MSTPPIPPNTPPREKLRPRPATVAKATGLNCPQCGSAIEIRTFSNAVNVICQSCHAVLDASDPKLKILQAAKQKMIVNPLIPLGTRGVWQGKTREVVGFQRRTINADGVDYHWFEYLLYNPFAGYRYLTEYNGHWCDVTVCHAIPADAGSSGAKPQMRMGDITYTHFQTANAHTTFILGEFPWQVRMGDTAQACDYISPPLMLSSETTPDETTWSEGEYVNGSEIWQAFKLKDAPPEPVGVYANQPSPYGDDPKHFWKRGWQFLGLALLIVFATMIMSKNATVYNESHSFKQGAQAEASYVTPEFELGGHESNVDVETRTDLMNDWVYFHFSLINTQTDVAYDFGREVSYYSGVDSDGSWTEGKQTDTATVPSVPPGKYYLRVEPEKDANTPAVNYNITVKRDVPTFWFFIIAAVLILVPPLFVSARSAKFEYRRWAESDYSGGGSSDDSDDSDSESGKSTMGAMDVATVAVGAVEIAIDLLD